MQDEHETEFTDSIDLDEDRGLLGDEDAKGHAYLSNTRLWCLSKLTRVTFIALVIVAVILSAFILLRTPGNLPSDDGDEYHGQIAIPLNPARHATREPTTLEFHWNITTGRASADGVEKNVYLVNGHFPGPAIEARSGDRIIVHAYNGLNSEGLSLHWHGFEMRGSNAMDGAVGYTQCPIPPGHEFTYDFTIGDAEHGTFWWHGHLQTQRGDGLYGGLIVHRPRRSVSSEKEALLLVSDWYHRSQSEVLAEFHSPASQGAEPTPDSILINGYGQYNCSMADVYKPVSCTQRVRLPLLKERSRTRLRVVNTAAITGITAMIEDATLQAIEVDGGCEIDTKPRSSVGILYPGQRVDLLLDWKSSISTSTPWFNIYLDPENFAHKNYYLSPNQSFAALPETALGDRLVAHPFSSEKNHLDLASITASTSTHLDFHTSAETFTFSVGSGPDQYNQGKTIGFMNGISWKPQLPPLLSLNRSSWDENQNVQFINVGHVNIVINNADDGAHAFHLHGSPFHVLASYRAPSRAEFPGRYDPKHPESGELGREGRNGGWVNYKNPVRRDTVSVPRWGHVLITFVADNPGLWMLHCHMLVHQGVGMAAGFQVGEGEDFEHVKGRNLAAAELCHV